MVLSCCSVSYLSLFLCVVATFAPTVFGAAWTDPDSPVFSAYQEWRNASTITYTHSTLLGSDDDVVVHWTIDDNMLYLGVVAAAGGWVGFGVADAGRMIGADIVVAVDEQCYY